MNELTIPFPIDPTSGNESLLFVGDKSRYSTMTSVALLSDSRLACANYYTRELMIVDFSLADGQFEVLHRCETRGDASRQRAGPSDLMDKRILGDGSVELLVSNFLQCSVSSYRFHASYGLQRGSTTVREDLGWCHGISFYPGDRDVVAFSTSGTTNPRAGVYLATAAGELLLEIREDGWLAKDMTFDGPAVMYAIYCGGAPKSRLRPRYPSLVVRYDLDLAAARYERTAALQIEACHVDAVTFHEGQLFITGERMDTPENGGVMVLDLPSEDSIVLKGVLGGYSFPHGLDIGYGLLAVTSYGTSDVRVTRLPW